MFYFSKPGVVLTIILGLHSITGLSSSLVFSQSNCEAKLKELSDWIEKQTDIPTDLELDQVKVWLKTKAKMLSHKVHTNLHREHEAVSKFFNEAVPAARKKGDKVAQAKLLQYYLGRGFDDLPKIPINFDEAIYWGTLCAAQDGGQCYTNLAFALEERDRGKSKRLIFCLYIMASQGGDDESLSNIGRCYKEGIGVAEDSAMAHYYFEIGASKNNVNAINSLADCHMTGYGVPRDDDIALNYFKRSALLGCRYARTKVQEFHQKNQELSLMRKEPKVLEPSAPPLSPTLPPYLLPTYEEVVPAIALRKSVCQRAGDVIQGWLAFTKNRRN